MSRREPFLYGGSMSAGSHSYTAAACPQGLFSGSTDVSGRTVPKVQKMCPEEPSLSDRKMNHTYDIIIPIFHPGREFARVLDILRAQEPAPERIILLETLEDGVSPVMYEGCEVIPVRKTEFDHAATRQLGVSRSKAGAFLFLTQDALPQGTDLAEKLLCGLYPENGDPGTAENSRDTRIALCYGRQLAGPESSEAERYTRSFNYPSQSRIKSAADLPELGIKTYFASNVCCMYDRQVFDVLGGFEAEAVFNEDMLYTAKALKQGYAAAYAAEACVTHSHNYSAMQYFHRMFDNGMSQAMHPEVFAGIRSEGEGKKLVSGTAAHLFKTGHPLQVFRLVWQSGWKYLGFSLGKNYRRFSKKQLRRLAMNKAFIDRMN